ncbi:MAG: MNIO family bufferin maturase [Methyloligellaceae bacterium]
MTGDISQRVHVCDSPIPARAGVGLKPEHYADILDTRPDIGWFEVPAENYMGAGGPPHHSLTAIRTDYPLSVHGVGLSIGSDGPLDKAHLTRLKAVCDRYEPGLFSEHLAWSTHDDIYLNDLLPVPYDDETLRRVAEHIDEVQTAVGRQMLLENPSTYVAFEGSDMSEIEFLSEVVRRTGCGLLLDVNNVHVSATNHNYDAPAYLDAFPVEHVGEIHMGGHAEDRDDAGAQILIDAHGSAVVDPVWDLYAQAIARAGETPTLIEWDNDVPAWPTLLAEAEHAERVMRARGTNHAAAG